MFASVLFIIEYWKQPSHPLFGEWTHKIWHIKKIELNSAPDNELQLGKALQRGFRNLMLGEKAKKQYGLYNVRTYVYI